MSLRSTFTMTKRKLLLIGVDQAIPYLIDKFLTEDYMPNLAKLASRGVKGEAFSCIPTDTPTNWTTIATGANVERHGATSFYIHLLGEPFEKGLEHKNRSRSQLRRFCNAEYIWDVADRAGLRPFVLNYPGGWPSKFQDGIMSLLTWRIPESLPWIISNPETKTFKVTFEDPNLNLTDTILATMIEQHGRGFDAIQIHTTGEILEIEEWSEWLTCIVETTHGKLPCLFKVKLIEVSQDGFVKIRYSTLYNKSGWTKPDSFGEAIIRNVLEPEFITGGSEDVEYWYESSIADYLKEAEQEARLISHAIQFSKREYDWRVCFFHVHFLDSVNHKVLAYLHEDSPVYTESGAEKSWNIVRNSYRIIDNLVGELLSTVVDEDTIVVFLADHGAVPAWIIANIPKALVDAGLLVYKPSKDNGNDTLQVDWTRTKAFPYLEPPYVWVNKKGRDPHGIVTDAKYEDVREEIIQALENMRDPETGEKIVRLALRREDAAYLGQNGERIGDVIFLLNPPYELFDGNVDELNSAIIKSEQLEKGIAYPATECYGAHAYYCPSTRFGPYSVSVPLIIAGPTIKSNVKLTNAVNLIDVAPTIARLLDIPAPAQSQGRILHEIVESNG
jgi:predicted AlkP superfamily phosphohydrolase/phosphomutase